MYVHCFPNSSNSHPHILSKWTPWNGEDISAYAVLVYASANFNSQKDRQGIHHYFRIVWFILFDLWGVWFKRLEFPGCRSKTAAEHEYLPPKKKVEQVQNQNRLWSTPSAHRIVGYLDPESIHMKTGKSPNMFWWNKWRSCSGLHWLAIRPHPMSYWAACSPLANYPDK